MDASAGPTITDWIGALAGAATLIVVAVAGIYASRAAHWTKEQAQSARRQVEIADEGLAIARKEAQDAQAQAERQRGESARMTRRFEESRIDAGMPTVLAVAAPGRLGPDHTPFVEMLRRIDNSTPNDDWRPVDVQLVLSGAETAAFRINMSLMFTNASAQIAEVAIIDPDHGETDVLSGGRVVLRPHESRKINWWRIVAWGVLQTEESINLPEVGLFRLRLLVRDLGLNAYDIHQFNTDVRLFHRDGSMLIVNPAPPFPWTEDYATPLPGRVYDRLDASAASDS